MHKNIHHGAYGRLQVMVLERAESRRVALSSGLGTCQSLHYLSTMWLRGPFHLGTRKASLLRVGLLGLGCTVLLILSLNGRGKKFNTCLWGMILCHNLL